MFFAIEGSNCSMFSFMSFGELSMIVMLNVPDLRLFDEGVMVGLKARTVENRYIRKFFIFERENQSSTLSSALE